MTIFDFIAKPQNLWYYESKGGGVMKKKLIAICLIAFIFILELVFRDHLIRAYVSLFHSQLEVYATQMLAGSEKTSDRYGVWKTSSYPEDSMVEFHTGGWGIAPASTYKGFYYSADNTHKLFSAAYEDTTSMETDGDRASWTDGTDNHGFSVRIARNWFWFEASF